MRKYNSSKNHIHMATITVGDAGPNAGASLTVPVCAENDGSLEHLTVAERDRLRAAAIRDVWQATHAAFHSDEFMGPVGDVAVGVAVGLLTEGELRKANIASVIFND